VQNAIQILTHYRNKTKPHSFCASLRRSCPSCRSDKPATPGSPSSSVTAFTYRHFIHYICNNTVWQPFRVDTRAPITQTSRVRGKIIRSVLCNAVQQLCTVHCTHIWTSCSLDWVLSHWAHFTMLRVIFEYVLLHWVVKRLWWWSVVVLVLLHACAAV